MPERKYVMLAAHDDGSGAFTIMCHLRNALYDQAEKRGDIDLKFIYLNGGSFDKEWTNELWKFENADRWEKKEQLTGRLNNSFFNNRDGIWLSASNYFGLLFTSLLIVKQWRDVCSKTLLATQACA